MTDAPDDATRHARLAPSPTGALHLGNACTFLLNWAMARRFGWRLHLRIEDLDTPRVKPEAAQGIADTLTWLGMDWDGTPTVQSHDLEPYREAMRRLADAGLVYPCSLTRAEVESAASAPHAGTTEVRFDPALRPPPHTYAFEDEATNWRFRTSDTELQFDDRLLGEQRTNPGQTVGDFVVWTKRAQPAYQLAVVVDDARQNVHEVIRGADLLASTGRQRLLIDALGLEPRPTYTHTPLIVGPDDRRLAKRHGDTRVDRYRQAGVPSEAIIGLVAGWLGLGPARTAMDAPRFVTRLNPRTILPDPPLERVTCSPEDDRWLLSHV